MINISKNNREELVDTVFSTMKDFPVLEGRIVRRQAEHIVEKLINREDHHLQLFIGNTYRNRTGDIRKIVRGPEDINSTISGSGFVFRDDFGEYYRFDGTTSANREQAKTDLIACVEDVTMKATIHFVHGSIEVTGTIIFVLARIAQHEKEVNFLGVSYSEALKRVVDKSNYHCAELPVGETEFLRENSGSYNVVLENGCYHAIDERGKLPGKFEDMNAAMWGSYMDEESAHQINTVEGRLITMDDIRARIRKVYPKPA